MDVYLDGKVICAIPDHMGISDTIIINNNVYEIITKTLDLNDNMPDLYCKIASYNSNDNKKSIFDILEEIYGSPFFITSGPNTNEIENNPRIIVLFIVISVLIDRDHLKKMADLYRNNAISLWNQKEISWEDIFMDNPKPIKDTKRSIPIITHLLVSSKIPKKLWPKSLSNND